MSKVEELTNYIKKLSQDTIQQLLDLVKCILLTSSLEKPCCPYCGSFNIILYGHKCGKQRFFCKDICNHYPYHYVLILFRHWCVDIGYSRHRSWWCYWLYCKTIRAESSDHIFDTKYLNRYNALFSTTYRNVDHLIEKLTSVLLSIESMDYFHSNKEVKTMGLLSIWFYWPIFKLTLNNK